MHLHTVTSAQTALGLCVLFAAIENAGVVSQMDFSLLMTVLCLKIILPEILYGWEAQGHRPA